MAGGSNVTGDFAGLGLLIANLGKLAEVPSQAASAASVQITKSLRAQFVNGVDPYGKPWAALRPSTLRSGRRPPPLTDSGKLAAGTGAKPMGRAGISLTVGAPYGVFHQTGTKNMAKRRILPDGAMPKAWSAILKQAASDAIRKRLGR